MYSLELLVTVGIAMLIIGAIIGAAIVQRTGSSQQTQRQLETQLSDLQQQAQNYQHEVTEHFNETAELLNQLTSSYRDVHNHLAKGAQTLATDERARQTIKMLPADEETSSTEPTPTNITPPLDYAPKTGTDGPGMLNEEFGLDKAKNSSDESIAANGDK